MAAELAGVTRLLAETLSGTLGGERQERRIGVPESAKPAIAAAIAAMCAGPAVLLTATPARSQALTDELTLFVDGLTVTRLPEREQLPYELTRDDPAMRIESARALGALAGGQPALVVASWAAFSEFRPPPTEAGAHVDVLPGLRLSPVEFVRQLEELGYVIEPLADAPGTVARRGGIVDVFPVGAEQPCRVEFFGDEVESVRRVDLATQRSVARIDGVMLPAAVSGSRAAQARARELAGALHAESETADAIIEQLELVASGNRSDFAAFLEPLLYRSTAAEHLAANATVIFDDVDDGREALTQTLEHQTAARDELERRGTIPRGLPPLNETPEALQARIRERASAVFLQRFGTDEFGARRLPLRTAPGFGGKVKVLAQQAEAWARDGLAVVIASQQALRLAELLDEEGVSATLTRALGERPNPGSITLLPAPVSGGFIVEGHAVLISDEEVFGFRRRRRPIRRRAAVQPDLLATIEVGEYVVHADHGIARFGGLVRRTLDGIEREYLELQYAEGDRLYVPTDQLDVVSRYVGPSDRPPALTRLGSQEWQRTRRRVKHAVAEMAHDLLELYARREAATGFAFAADNAWQLEMEAAFPFVETPDQLDAIREVKADMESGRPMDRLICGDVGYGKTEVAARAAFKAVMNGKQVAMLVPTTVLAEQHGETFRERMAGFPVRVEVLSRFRSDAEQRAIVSGLADGSVDVVIGTHRVLQKDVSFKDLGLVIIDEEQRFGVAHKERLKQMRAEVDVLALSATPIPRTLQMSLAGIRDMSSVMTPPEERQPVRTYVTGWDDEIVREAIRREIGRGGQVYFVHNRVHNIERIVRRLRELVPEADITVGHGQMREEQLERVMAEFAAGEHDILVCTTIIESGLDIPNVNTIIINNADQFGLAQLYQLRGRVGRSAARAYAYLLYDRDRAISEQAQKRLEAIFEASDLGAGFQIALRDLEIRGAGNLLGTEQSGHIAAVGFDMYSKLVAEAVAALKAAMRPAGEAARPSLPPVPSVDLPISAAIPERYIGDLNLRLATYQRIAEIDSAEGVARMQEELRDRFGPPPPLVEHLLYVALVKALARRANVESISTTEQLFHIRVRGGLRPEQRRAVEALRHPGALIGPNQVRLDRMTLGEDWMQALVRVLRTMGSVDLAAA
ncbi:MAG: transcription-repair coupling factor [Dehalococcoidia bacterium]